MDDRGNVTWEWSDDPDLVADDTLGGAERMRALVDPTLKVKDDDDDPSKTRVDITIDAASIARVRSMRAGCSSSPVPM